MPFLLPLLVIVVSESYPIPSKRAGRCHGHTITLGEKYTFHNKESNTMLNIKKKYTSMPLHHYSHGLLLLCHFYVRDTVIGEILILGLYDINLFSGMPISCTRV